MIVNLLMTGNELMTGVTIDRNSAWIAEQLLGAGIHVTERRTVGDELGILVSSIEQLSLSADLLIINGGLGPTSDDLTAEALAKSCGVQLDENSQARAALEQWSEQRNISLNKANLKQIYLPAGCTVVPNPTGSASGFAMELNDCLVICTPGVPSELKGMFHETILGMIEQRFGITHETEVTRLQLFGTGESSLQQMIHDELPDWPEEVEIGFRAGRPMLELKLTIFSNKHRKLRDACLEKILTLVKPYFVGFDNDTLASVLVKTAKEKEIAITAAESCTGGRIASEITAIAGASAIFEAGIVSYSNNIKQQVLGVSNETLEQYGAVSEAVVREMLIGALRLSHADIGVAISGIAGPDGGSDDKPVGTVWLAWGSKDNIITEQFHLPFGRSWFQQLASSLALDLLRRYILGEHQLPKHMNRYLKK